MSTFESPFLLFVIWCGLLPFASAISEGLWWAPDVNLTTPSSVPPAISFSPQKGVYASQALYFGGTIKGVGDVNNDGYSDFLIGAYRGNYNESGQSDTSQTGVAWLVFGRRSWTPTSSDWPSIRSLPNAALGVILYSRIQHQHVGFALSDGCDLNADGIPDLVIAGTGQNAGDVSPVFVVFGRTTWPSTICLDSLKPSDYGFMIKPLVNTGYSFNFGSCLKCVSDYNGDKINDLLIGDSSAPNNGGRVYLLYGRSSSSEWPSLVNISATSNPQGALINRGVTTTDGLGTGLEAVDLNVDGKVDLVLGASGFNGNLGVIFVIWGNQSFTTVSLASTPPPIRFCFWKTSQNGALLGQSLSSGDVNGDGYDDLVASTRGTPSTVSVILAKSTISCSYTTYLPPSLQFSSPDEGTLDSIVVADVNGDSCGDVIVGYTNYLSGLGRIYIWFGFHEESLLKNVTITSNSKPQEGNGWARITPTGGSGFFGSPVSFIRGEPNTADDLLIAADQSDKILGSVYLLSRFTCLSYGSNKNNCTKCIGGYGLTNGNCKRCSEENQFSDGTTPCLTASGCAKCVSSTGKCRQQCLDSSTFFKDKNGVCLPCKSPSGCLSCEPINGTCAICVLGKVAVGGVPATCRDTNWTGPTTQVEISVEGTPNATQLQTQISNALQISESLVKIIAIVEQTVDVELPTQVVDVFNQLVNSKDESVKGIVSSRTIVASMSPSLLVQPVFGCYFFLLAMLFLI